MADTLAELSEQWGHRILAQGLNEHPFQGSCDFRAVLQVVAVAVQLRHTLPDLLTDVSAFIALVGIVDVPQLVDDPVDCFLIPSTVLNLQGSINSIHFAISWLVVKDWRSLPSSIPAFLA